MALLSKLGDVLTAEITKDFKLKKKIVEQPASNTFVEQLKKRRSIYDLGKRIHYSQAYIAELIQESVRSCPSAYNSKSTRIVVLFGESHQKFWNIVRDVERRNMPISVFEGVDIKIGKCASAFGTVLFYEDQSIVHQLQKKVPFSANEFPLWSEQTSGMAQFAIWTSLADLGLGASLQHYNPTIDRAVSDYFNIEQSWLMKAQLVFGSIEGKALDKEEFDDHERFRVYV